MTKKLSIEQQIDLKLERANKVSIQALAGKYKVTYAVAQSICNKSLADLEAAAVKEEEELTKAQSEREALLAAKARVSAAKAKVKLEPEDGTLHIEGTAEEVEV